MNWTDPLGLSRQCLLLLLLFVFLPASSCAAVLLVADSEGKLFTPKGTRLVQMTLMMHSWVVPSQMFAQKLLALYPPLSLSSPPPPFPRCPAPNHMCALINQIREQAWLCFVAALPCCWCLE